MIYRPNVIVNCASISNAAYCEKNKVEAFRVNAIGARNLAAVKDEKVRQEAGEITSNLRTLLDDSPRNGRFSRTVITGCDSAGWIVYKLIKVTPDHIMEMRILCPPYRKGDDKDKDKDKNEKCYVQECIYRYCSFADDEIEPPRSYSDYLKAQGSQ